MEGGERSALIVESTMIPQTRLSAFKILDGVVGISLVDSQDGLRFPVEFCDLLADAKVNLIFFACGRQEQGWGVDIAVDSGDGKKVSHLIAHAFPKTAWRTTKSGILSLFPHRSDPTVAGSLFHILGMTEIEPEALSYSNSAISVVLREETIETTTKALFEPFQFSAYRTPADWRLAQKGKEQLYKEVIASYQEKKPKVYGLQWQEAQNLFIVGLENHDISPMGDAFVQLSKNGALLQFLTSSPSLNQRELQLFLCLPEFGLNSYPDLFKKFLPEAVTEKIAPVGVFTMNGPHFGDRYGIVSELMQAFNKVNIELLALGCAIASITGVVPSEQIDKTTHAIKENFNVPTVMRKR